MLKSITDAPQDVQDAIMEFFPQEQWDNAASVSYLESKWNGAARDDTTNGGATPCGTIIGQRLGVYVTAEDSLGVFQINSCNFPSWAPESLLDVRQNVGTAHMLWAFRGWAPWYFSAKALGLL